MKLASIVRRSRAGRCAFSTPNQARVVASAANSYEQTHIYIYDGLLDVYGEVLEFCVQEAIDSLCSGDFKWCLQGSRPVC
jgi:hypothetical protein